MLIPFRLFLTWNGLNLCTLSIQHVLRVYAKILCELKRLARFHMRQHLDSLTDVGDAKTQVVRVLTLRTPILQNCECMEKQLRLRSNHVDDHEKHLLFAMFQVPLIELRQLQLRVYRKHIFVGWQRVNRMLIE